MKFNKKSAISMIEIGFIVFVLFFLYVFVVKQMLSDLKFSDLKRIAANTYNELDRVSRGIINNGGFPRRFKDEGQVIAYFAKELRTEEVCKSAKKNKCWSSNWIWSSSKKPGIKLETGQYIVVDLTSASCSSNLNIPNTCGIFYVDINGSAAPNLIGHDIIKLYFTSNGIIPAGTKYDIINPANSCDMYNKFSWACSARLLGMK